MNAIELLAKQLTNHPSFCGTDAEAIVFIKSLLSLCYPNSDKKILAVLDEKQLPPENPFELGDGNADIVETYDLGQWDMIHDGWKKTAEEK